MEDGQNCDQILVPVVTAEGPIYGYLTQIDNEPVYHFHGIPYAKPPLGNLRFLPPLPVQHWTTPIDCTKEPQKCCTYTDVVVGSEDCLYLSLSTPCMKPDKPLPVMFWVESFTFSFSLDTTLDPSLLLQEGVLFVKCGFRVGPFGFLSINDLAAPGNAGLKDVVMALKWVQRNISTFGGDPNNVTLFGTNCGGSIVHCMMLSSMATGLFHRAIVQSLSALNTWMFAKNPYQAVLILAKELGLETQCKFEIVDILKTLPAEEIRAACGKIISRMYQTSLDQIEDLFKPCIENEFEGQVAFLTKSPFLVLKSGKFNKVPLIIGSNNTEAGFLQYVKDDFNQNYDVYNKSKRLIVPKSMAEDVNVNNINQQLLKFYMGEEEEDGSLRPDTTKQYVQLIHDYYFLYYINKSVRMHSRFLTESPVYYYVLNYSGNWNVPEPQDHFNSMGYSGELPCIFGIKPPNMPVCRGNRDSMKLRQRVVKLWTNFAKCGNPTPEDSDPLLQITWDAVESDVRLNYLSIGCELTKGRNPFADRMKFWDQLHTEHTFLRTLMYFSDRGVRW